MALRCRRKRRSCTRASAQTVHRDKDRDDVRTVTNIISLTGENRVQHLYTRRRALYTRVRGTCIYIYVQHFKIRVRNAVSTVSTVKLETAGITR